MLRRLPTEHPTVHQQQDGTDLYGGRRVEAPRACGPNNLCLDGRCQDVQCQPGAKSCRDKDLLTCNDQGEWQTETTCAFVCDVDQRVGECVPGAVQCDGNAERICDPTGHWLPSEACPNL